MNKIKKLIIRLAPIIDLFISPLTLIGSIILKGIRKIGIFRMPISKKIFFKVGVFPIMDHFYEPMFNHKKYLNKSVNDDRYLPGIDLNIEEQIELLNKFNYSEELKKFPDKKEDGGFYYKNVSFSYGDSEYYYNMIRHFKPRRIIEVGCGNSTLIASKAIWKNCEDENASWICNHMCIEPYENFWLRDLTRFWVKDKVENVSKFHFELLEKNDILFIDSSHMIRPQGDVLYLILEILPILKKGVIIHFYDIFTPKDYRENELLVNVRFWNEQYLLEAFLSNNPNFKIIGALNYLINNQYKLLLEKCPNIYKKKVKELSSFWIQKI